jgi:hypothetical protein
LPCVVKKTRTAEGRAMDESIVVVATTGFAVGAGLAFLVSVYAPGSIGQLRLYALAGLIILPVALGFAGAQQLMNAGWDQADFRNGAWAYFFILPQPLGVLCASTAKGVGKKLVALAGGLLVFLPMYLMFTVSMLAANVVGQAL